MHMAFKVNNKDTRIMLIDLRPINNNNNIYIYIYIYVCVCVYIYIYVYVYIYIYISAAFIAYTALAFFI